MIENRYIGMGRSPDPKIPDIPEGLSMALMQDPGASACFQRLSDTQIANIVKYVQSGNATGYDAKEKIRSVMEKLRNNSLIEI